MAMTRVTHSVTIPALLLVALALLAGGCDEQERIHSYKAPKPPPPAPESSPGGSGPMAGGDGPMAGGAGMPAGGGSGQQRTPAVNWSVPEGWREAGGQGSMRLATFEAGPSDNPIEIAVTALGQNPGGALANVNRWRRQLGLGPRQQAPEPVSRFTTGRLNGRVFDITAPVSGSDTAGERILVAMIEGPGRTWFVKVRDTPDRVATQRQALIAFAESFTMKQARMAAQTAPVGTQPAHDHGGTLAQGQQVTGPDGRARWTVPSDWESVEPTGDELKAYRTRRPAGDVRISVIRMPGEKAIDAINQWRQQLGKDPIGSLGEQPFQPAPLAGTEGRVTQMATRQRRIVAVMLERDGQTWFLKAEGPLMAVSQQASMRAFGQFIVSFRFNGDGS
jgi:hypothetical protein